MGGFEMLDAITRKPITKQDLEREIVILVNRIARESNPEVRKAYQSALNDRRQKLNETK